jgi:hypothetical protein
MSFYIHKKVFNALRQKGFGDNALMAQIAQLLQFFIEFGAKKVLMCREFYT